MKKRKILALAASHLFFLGVGFAIGIYVLPILTAPPAPDYEMVEQASKASEFVGMFSKDRKDSDAFHWGEGEFAIGPDSISFLGSLAPGPDYKLYLSPEFVETKVAFNQLKSSMVQIGDVKTFENFIVSLSSEIDPSNYTAAIVWCESFGQFITSGAYKVKLDPAQ
jgi:hypothetical protein